VINYQLLTVKPIKIKFVLPRTFHLKKG